MANSEPTATALENLPNIPLGVSDWDSLREGRYLVVDKTAKLKKLVAYRSVFFARPRRMGKSTLCSMLHELFAHGKESFAGQAIYELWTEKTYPVIHLSFKAIAVKKASDFEFSLRETLVAAFSEAGFPEVKSFAQTKTLNGFLRQFNRIAQQRQLVFLIDEWDYSLSHSLDNAEDCNVFMEVLEIFYSWLRELPNLRFVLVTGIMRYRETSLFSGQDIQDLSMEPYFADLLGYTQEELQQAFAQYITLAAERKHLTEAQLLEQLQLYYAGFCFDYDASTTVYCPYAVNRFFSVVKSKHKVPYFASYWMRSANAASALSTYLRQHALEQDELKELCEQQFTLSYDEITSANYFGPVTFKQLLVQAGYFSIKSIAGNELDDDDDEQDDPERRKFNCAITNKDVAKEFVPVLKQYLQERDLRGDKLASKHTAS